MDELDNLLDNYSKPDLEIPLEKRFEIAKFNNLIEGASKEQAIELAKQAWKLMLIREHTMNELLKYEWGLTDTKAA